MSRDANGNGSHFKLGCWIIGLVVGPVMCITGAGMAYQAGVTRDQDARIRANEQAVAASRERFDAIKQSLDRIERQLEKGKTP